MHEPLPAPRPENTRRDLLYDPQGETCSRVPVFRHPFYRKLQPACYLVMPALLLLSLFVSPPYSFFAALCGSVLFLGVVWLSLFAAHQHGSLAAAWERGVRRALGLRFLCPECLRFGPVRHACGACGGELEPFVIHTRGLYLNDCARCRARIFPTSWAAGTPPNARCNGCGAMLNANLHSLRVRVVGVLCPSDLEAVAEEVDTSAHYGWGGGHLYHDLGTERVYVLDVAEVEPEGDFFSERHAAREVEALWLDAVLDEPLNLGETLDRFFRRAGISEARRKVLPVFIARKELAPAVRNVLAGRLGCLTFGATPHAALRLRAKPGKPGERGA